MNDHAGVKARRGLGRIYLDYAATTPVLPEVKEAMRPWIEEHFGNPSSLYLEGRQAKEAIDAAREVLSAALQCLFAEVIFTSSGTESANLAIIGAALANRGTKRTRVLFSAAEHHCVLNTSGVLERLGYQVDLVPVDRESSIDLNALEEALDDDVLLVSAMHANNETGRFNDVTRISELSHRRGAIYHCDAVQSFQLLRGSGWVTGGQGPDLLSLSSHKVYGPKGAGALYVRAGTKLTSLISGGGQERELRGGTENVAAIVGFAAAVKGLSHTSRRTRDRFLEKLEGAVLTVSDLDNCLAGHAHIRFPGIQAETMLILLDRMGVSASSGAACSSGSIEPSHVLLACGYTEGEAKEGLRFTFGGESTIEEAEEAARRVNEAAAKIRSAR